MFWPSWLQLGMPAPHGAFPHMSPVCWMNPSELPESMLAYPAAKLA